MHSSLIFFCNSNVDFAKQMSLFLCWVFSISIRYVVCNSIEGRAFNMEYDKHLPSKKLKKKKIINKLKK